MRGLLAHKRAKTIADELGLSPKTVYGYIAEATALLGASDQADAASKYLKMFGPGEIPGETDRVVDAPETTAFIVSQPASSSPVGRGLERYSKLRRLGIVMALTLAITFGLGLSVVAVVGLISIHETARDR
jgi:hypothetical protein